MREISCFGSPAWGGDYELANDLAQDAVCKGITNKSQLQDPDKYPA